MSSQRGSIRIILLMVIIGLVGAWGQYDQKREQSKSALVAQKRALDDIVNRWEGDVKIAGATSLVFLSSPVNSLLGLREEAQKLVVWPCMEASRGHLVKQMDTVISAFLILMTKKYDEAKVAALFDSAVNELTAYRSTKDGCTL